MTTNIIPENERSATICESILDAIEDKGKLLTKWRDAYELLYDDDHDIPLAEELTITKIANNGVITTDTCNGARKTAELLVAEIRALCIAKGMTEDEIRMYLLDCYNHLRNVWIGAMDKELSTHLSDVMQEDLDNIDPRLRVSTKFGVVLFALDKEFSLCCNYAKGDGEAFLAWMERYHPGSFLLPVERSSGSRQDLTVEGAGAVYMNRTYYVDFLDECITANSNNILQTKLFIVLTSSQMIAMSHVYAIFHVAICLPMRFLVGKAHKLADQD